MDIRSTYGDETVMSFDGVGHNTFETVTVGLRRSEYSVGTTSARTLEKTSPGRTSQRPNRIPN